MSGAWVRAKFSSSGDVRGLDRQLAALRHGVAGVHGQVHDDLVDLAWIGAHGAQLGAWNHDQIDVLADHAREHLQVLGDHLVQIEHFGGQHLFAAEGQQLPGQRSGALRGIGDFLRRAAQPRIGTEPIEQKLGVAGDHHQQVIEVVRDAAGEAADRFHFLRLTELQLQRSGLGDVFHEDFEGASFFAVRNRTPGNSRHDRRAILAHALGGQVIEFLPRVKIIGGLKPLLGIGVQASQMPAREFGGTAVSEHATSAGFASCRIPSTSQRQMP